MRTTVTLDDDVAAQLQRLAAERGEPFKVVLNATLRAGLSPRRAVKGYRLPARRMGVRPGVDLDRAAALAAALEDEETARELEHGA